MIRRRQRAGVGRRMDANEFRNNQWARALRVLSIRYRDFYATKDTAISLDITGGEHAKKVAQEAGISLMTLERNYGMYLDRAVRAQVQRQVQPRQRKNRKRLENNLVEWRPRRDLNSHSSQSDDDAKTNLIPESFRAKSPKSEFTSGPGKTKKRGAKDR